VYVRRDWNFLGAQNDLPGAAVLILRHAIYIRELVPFADTKNKPVRRRLKP
jgi:hypothetical protein